MSDGAYQIRAADIDDLDRLTELLLALQDHVEGANPTLWQMTGQGRQNLKGQIRGRLTAQDARALVAEHPEQGVVGMIFGRVVVNNRYTPAQAGQIDQAFVHPNHRRRGVGALLAAGICRFFAEQGVEDLTLRYALGNDEAVAFWQALGFAPRIVVAGASRQEIEARLAQMQARANAFITSV